MLSLKVNKNRSTTTLKCLIVRAIEKALSILHFLPDNIRFLFFCSCLLFFFSFITLFLPYFIILPFFLVINFSCKISNKAVANNHNPLRCDKCHIWVHMKFSKKDLQIFGKKPFGQNLIDQVNGTMDDPSSEAVCNKYYGPCEISSLLNNS